MPNKNSEPMLKRSVRVYLPDKRLKKTEKNLKILTITIGGDGILSIDGLSRAMESRVISVMENSLISSFVNPPTPKKIAHWVSGRIGYLMKPLAKYFIEIELNGTKEFLEFKSNSIFDPIGTVNFELYANHGQFVRYTEIADLKVISSYQGRNVNLITVFCPPYDLNWKTRQYKGLFDSIESNPYTHDDWNYEYKHFIDVIDFLSKNLRFSNQLDAVAKIYIADVMINDYIIMKQYSTEEKLSNNISRFITSAQDYCKNNRYDNISILPLNHELEKLQCFPKLPKGSPSSNSEIKKFLQQYVHYFPILQVVLELKDSDLRDVLQSDNSIIFYSKKYANLQKELTMVLKTAVQIYRMSSPNGSLMDGLLKSLKKYVFYKVCGLALTNNKEQNIFISLDTGFPYTAKMFGNENLPLLHIDPFKVPTNNHKYKKTSGEISIVVPVHKTPQLMDLLRTLSSAADTGLGSINKVEVLVLSNGENGESSSITKQFLKEYPEAKLSIKVVELQKTGIAVARNEGIRAASYGIIGFIDADCVVPNDYFQTLAEEIPHIGPKTILKGRIIFETTNPNKFLLRRVKDIRTYYSDLDKDIFYTAHMYLHKRQFEEIGDFDENAKNGEDRLWSIKAVEKGYSAYMMETAVRHVENISSINFLNSWKAYGATRSKLILSEPTKAKMIKSFFKAVRNHLRDFVLVPVRYGIESWLLFVIIEIKYWYGFFQATIQTTKMRSIR